METPSSQTLRGPGPWQGLLLAVSLSTFWIPPVTAKPTVESVPLNAAEGQDVLLLVRSVTGNPLRYDWYKGTATDSNLLILTYVVSSHVYTTGPAHSGRETLHTNGSLVFQNITQNDTGSYTFAVTYSDGNKDEATGQLRVHLVLPKPHISSNNSNPMEDKDTVELTCEPETQDTTYLWSINSQSLPDSPRLQLSKDNRTLTLLRVTRNDTGLYLCDTQNPVSASRSDPFILNVLSSRDNTDCSTMMIAAFVIGVLLGVLLTATLGCVLVCRRTGRTRDKHDLTEHQPPTSSPDMAPSGRSNLDPQPDTKPHVPIYQELQYSSKNTYSWINHMAEVAS